MLNTLTSATAALLGQWNSSSVSAPSPAGSGFGELVQGTDKDGRNKGQSSSGRKEDGEAETQKAAAAPGSSFVSSDSNFSVDLPAMPRRALDLTV